MPEVQPQVSLWNRPYDAKHLLHDGVAAITPTAGGVAGVVALAAGIVFLGVGQAKGEMIVDLQALDIGTGDELYGIVLQGADDIGFTVNKRVLATLVVGHSSKTGESATSLVGRYVVPFRNNTFKGAAGPVSPSAYVRTMAHAFAGTVAGASFDYKAYLSIDVA